MSDDLENWDWNDTKLGGRVRVAIYLAKVVKEGGKFTSLQLAKAIPGIGEIDRRMRDLRPAGWVIGTYRDTGGLKPDELQLIKIGDPVWEPGKRSAGLRTVSVKTRRMVFERDQHRCVRCGITAGEAYPDDPDVRARLTLGHVRAHKDGGGATVEDLVTECARCNEQVKQFTGPNHTDTQVWDRIAELNRKDKAELLAWMVADLRPVRDVERAWSMYRQLPAAARDEIKVKLARALPEA